VTVLLQPELNFTPNILKTIYKLYFTGNINSPMNDKTLSMVIAGISSAVVLISVIIIIICLIRYLKYYRYITDGSDSIVNLKSGATFNNAVPVNDRTSYAIIYEFNSSSEHTPYTIVPKQDGQNSDGTYKTNYAYINKLCLSILPFVGLIGSFGIYVGVKGIVDPL